MHSFFRLLLAFTLVVVFVGVVFSQPTGGGPGGGGDPDVPIDGFIGLLAAAGALLGIKKLRQKNNKGD